MLGLISHFRPLRTRMDNQSNAFLIIYPISSDNPDRSTFVSPAMMLDGTLPTPRHSAGKLESAAIFCVDLKCLAAMRCLCLCQR